MAANNSTIQEEGEAINLEYLGFRITRITLYIFILILSCVGNSLVAIVIVRARGMRTSSNLLILNLALCDFITPALSIPFDLAFEESNYIWPFGKAMCKMLWPFQTVFSTSSTLTLVAISLDRFRTLVKPFTGHVPIKKLVTFVLTIHTFSIGLCVPYFIALDYDASSQSCGESWPSVRYRQTYTIVLFLCQYALPLITMSVAYLLIYQSLHSNLASLFAMDPERRPRNCSWGSGTLSKDSMEFRRKEQNIRLAKMFVIVVVVFAISMFPNQVLWLWVDFGNGANNGYFHYISLVCRIFTYANSVLNPFIYALKSREFRSGFAKIGRKTVMQPLRKISTETRRYVRKVSRNVLDNDRPITAQKKSSACVDISDEYAETFELSPSELSSLRDGQLRFTFERKRPVPRRKFSCYEIGDVKGLCMEKDFPSVAPIQNGSAVHFAGQERNRISVDKCDTFRNEKATESSVTDSDVKTDISSPDPETLCNARSSRFIEELRETNC